MRLHPYLICSWTLLIIIIAKVRFIYRIIQLIISTRYWMIRRPSTIICSTIWRSFGGFPIYFAINWLDAIIREGWRAMNARGRFQAPIFHGGERPKDRIASPRMEADMTRWPRYDVTASSQYWSQKQTKQRPGDLQ